MKKTFIILSILATALSEENVESNIKREGEIRKFPEGFMLGTATASYQIEGAWNVADKSQNIWDTLTHNNPTVIADGSSGDEAADSYHNYKRDVEMLRELGVDFYRISLSWSRILPTGYPNYISEDGVNFYNNYINEMLAYNITPMVTLYHWDLPQSLQDLGGWANPLIVDWFTDYARVAFEAFGDRVKIWLTINEPKQICLEGYGGVTKAPMVDIKGVGEYLCAYSLLLAHAKAYHMYNEEFKPVQGGKIGITVDLEWYDALTDTAEDHQAAEDYRQFEFGIYTHPIFSSEGDFPKNVKERVAAKSAAQGFPRSRLPEFTPQQIDFIKGSADYLGINHYSTRLTYRNESVFGLYNVPSYKDDVEAEIVRLPSETDEGGTSTSYIPWGFRAVLNFVRERYDNPEVMVTENGFGSDTRKLEDNSRVSYYRGYLAALLDAIDDGCHVTAYAAWTLLDNFEWTWGYSMQYGIYEVDFSSPEKTRTPRKSAVVYKEIIKTRALDPNYEPESLDISLQ